MLLKGAKIVMTSRDYIYRRARNDLKVNGFPVLLESQVVIDAHNLTSEERQQILYNHIKIGRQEKAFRSAIKLHLPAIANNPHFVPETARRLADPLYDSDEPAEDYMQPLLDSLATLKDEFADEAGIVSAIDSVIESIEAWVSEHTDEYSEPRLSRAFGEIGDPHDPLLRLRGIFDDVDE